MGRNGQPLELLLAKGKKHLTKAEIEHRQTAEIKTGTRELKCPDYIKNDVHAFKKWKEILRVYKDVDFVSSGDVGLLARYCMTHSEYLRLIETRKRLEDLEADWDRYEGMLPESFTEQVTKLLKLNPLLQLETAINKKMDLLIKMEDRSFLNPLAKVKNIPKKEEPKKPTKFEESFGDV